MFGVGYTESLKRPRRTHNWTGEKEDKRAKNSHSSVLPSTHQDHDWAAQLWSLDFCVGPSIWICSIYF